MVYIAYFTELNSKIWDYAQKQRICRENCNYALDERFHGHVCSRRKPAKSCHPDVDVDIPQVTSALGRSGRLCMRCWQHAQMGGPLPPYGHPWLWWWWWDDVGENAKWCAGCWWLWTTTRCGWLLTFIFGHPWSWWRGEGYKHIALLQVMFDDEKVTRLMICW